jgi:outer membrane protein assembly factor BamD
LSGAAAVLLASLLIAGCAGKSGVVREKTARELYDQGARLAERKSYDEALEAFKEAAKGYRDADLDADIQIALADAYFSKKEFPAAVEAYTEFLRLHPHNPRADYAQFRVALSWQKLMGSPDRSPEPARKAFAAYEALLRGYPRSGYLEQGRSGVAAARRRLAEHEMYVADFYFNTGKYPAAAGRYELVLRDFPDTGFADRVLYRLGECYGRMREREKADQFHERLRREHPQSRFVRDLDKSKG